MKIYIKIEIHNLVDIKIDSIHNLLNHFFWVIYGYFENEVLYFFEPASNQYDINHAKIIIEKYHNINQPNIL